MPHTTLLGPLNVQAAWTLFDVHVRPLLQQSIQAEAAKRKLPLVWYQLLADGVLYVSGLQFAARRTWIPALNKVDIVDAWRIQTLGQSYGDELWGRYDVFVLDQDTELCWELHDRYPHDAKRVSPSPGRDDKSCQTYG